MRACGCVPKDQTFLAEQHPGLAPQRSPTGHTGSYSYRTPPRQHVNSHATRTATPKSSSSHLNPSSDLGTHHHTTPHRTQPAQGESRTPQDVHGTAPSRGSQEIGFRRQSNEFTSNYCPPPPLPPAPTPFALHSSLAPFHTPFFFSTAPERKKI